MRLSAALPLILLLAGLLLACSSSSEEAPPLAAGDARFQGVEPVEVARVPSYCEGVVVDHEGNLYISHGAVISKVTPAGEVTQWAETGAPNGHKILADGTHLVCDRSRHAVLRLSAEGEILGAAAETCGERPLDAPNDLALDPADGFYFTDPTMTRDRPAGVVCYVDSAGNSHLVQDEMWVPNGLVLRPDGKTLLVAESDRNRIVEFSLSAPGVVGSRRTFAELPQKGPDQFHNKPDGMALDEKGNLYVAHWGMRQVQVLDPEGRLIASLAGGNLKTSNVAFAGPERNQLYVTGGLTAERDSPGVLYRLDLPGVRGRAVLPEQESAKGHGIGNNLSPWLSFPALHTGIPAP